MKTEILEKTFGRPNGFSYDMVTWVRFGSGELGVVEIHYDVNSWSHSTARITLIGNDRQRSDVVLRSFPSFWWHQVPKGGELREVPDVLLTETSVLVVRMQVLLGEEPEE